MSASGKAARLPLIDPLRAIAALLIFVYHALFVTGNLSRGDYGWFLNVGVPLFYGISGLLLFRRFAGSIVNGSASPNLREYAKHRVFRIIPAYWFALPVIAVVLGRSAQVFSLEGLVRYFGLTQAYSLDTFVGGIGQAWTLTVEVAFYVFLPFWGWFCSRVASKAADARGRGRALLLLTFGLAVFSLAWKIGVVNHYGNDVTGALVPFTALPAALDQFCVGMAIAVLIALRDAGVSGRLLATIAKVPAVGIGMALVAYWLVGEVYGIGPIRGHELGGWGMSTILEHEGKAAVTAGLLLAGVAAVPGVGMVGRALNIGPLRRVGEMSYGFYLWHLAVLTLLVGNLHWALGEHGLLGNPEGIGITSGWPLLTLGVVVSLAVSLGIAGASWALIERPLIRRAHT